MLIGFLISIVAVLSFTLNSLLKAKNQNTDSEKEKVDVLNLYNNTDELVKKFQVINPTTVNDGIEKNIQNRLLTGFENWNRGFKTWKEWGNILYIPESIYNVHGARLSLASYQAAMDISLQQATILMGDFHNMLITDKYCAIHYDFTTNGKTSKVMEFVHFEETPEHGTYVFEGWGSTKDASYNGLINFQAEKEKKEEKDQTDELLSLQIPTTTDLKTKYPIKFPTYILLKKKKNLK